jgi:D-aminoacyl-tRNA deacylase
MRVVLQRVLEASVKVDGTITGSIDKGILVLAGFEDVDTDEDLDWISSKILNLRIFDDSEGVMNLSLTDVGGSVLCVSQFTLHAGTKKGNRPSYIRAARPEIAKPMYERFMSMIATKSGKKVEAGIFGADMKVSLVNDGPITIVIDSKAKE